MSPRCLAKDFRLSDMDVPSAYPVSCCLSMNLFLLFIPLMIHQLDTHMIGYL